MSSPETRPGWAVAAALSEGFCLPCRAGLEMPEFAVDGDCVAMALRCSRCRRVYLQTWLAAEGRETE